MFLGRRGRGREQAYEKSDSRTEKQLLTISLTYLRLELLGKEKLTSQNLHCMALTSTTKVETINLPR
ncbi:Hypothetical predicted protein [Pelobates cultripes]|uniref:Uncharacterized protein n=1 Tax=Pelobates cultripes TaxID=61616 RepID=A0AAD1SX35_PELCU|nr:Hypothetical predicted protein [Pelobates cultripes]